jgi:hypothetical protein
MKLIDKHIVILAIGVIIVLACLYFKVDYTSTLQSNTAADNSYGQVASTNTFPRFLMNL